MVEDKSKSAKSNLWVRNLAIVLFICMLLIVGFAIYNQVMRSKYNPLKNAEPNAVTLYTTDWCGYCKALRTYLDENKIPFKEYDVELSEEGYWGHRSVGGKGVPVMVIGEEIFYGFGKRNLPKINATLEKSGYKLKEVTL